MHHKESSDLGRSQIIAVPADGQVVAEHFARAPAFAISQIADGKVGQVTIEVNPGRPPGGLAGFLVAKGVTGVLVGQIGSRSTARLVEQGLWVETDHTGPIEQVLKSYAARCSDPKEACQT